MRKLGLRELIEWLEAKSLSESGPKPNEWEAPVSAAAPHRLGSYVSLAFPDLCFLLAYTFALSPPKNPKLLKVQSKVLHLWSPGKDKHGVLCTVFD